MYGPSPPELFAEPGADNVIEMLLLDSATDLVPCLIHFSTRLREGAMNLFLQLASIFETSFEVTRERESLMISESPHANAQLVLRTISPHIRNMALGFVCRLEALYYHEDPNVRVCTHHIHTYLYIQLEPLMVSVVLCAGCSHNLCHHSHTKQP